MLVTFKDVNARLDMPLEPAAQSRVDTLIEDAETMIRTAFLKCGRDFDAELNAVPWLEVEAHRVVREMVSAAILVGPNAGVRSVSSTTGPQSDSVTYADVDSVSFGGVRLTDQQRLDLGLCFPGGARGRFPAAPRWPEVVSWPRR
ncbi:phage Gp19/Gp15/Gp42 family protein [Corynebacterium sanguinis]|uniref:phage Gp19/Gp15/Gp42 family protein n=1 Tax=Corynebacterium sanguinis TaxID=2594913 RepID=UPI0021A63CED|nr:phage Gp19/Gp15/Gp42 family protein [Corynebacterium sanguinis]MCT1491349.1 phage Gp19/Gp15/Gp42 family protein [Corynebacterium sanguinis]MCT2246732.1 phage Gp19/Gp15/Gp42 family protein [Corynebacterium sanguinis]